MSKLLKLAGIIVIFAVVLMILERWFNIFYLGRLYESYGMGIAVLGWLSPVIAIGLAVYLVIKLVKFKA